MTSGHKCYERLYFTVVGPAVNEVARIAAMCRSVERNVLLSQAFADAMARSGTWSAGLRLPLCVARRRAAAGAVDARSVLDRASDAGMKPYVICHMAASVDGRILSSRWRPKGVDTAGLFERLHELLGGDAWLVGRVTGQEFAKTEAYPDHTDQTYPREPWFARRDAEAWGVVLDAHGKIAWGRSDIGGDPIVAVLTEQVSDAHLAGLRRDGVSYIFAGEQDLDLGLALEILNRELGVKRLLVEGGGGANGAFLRRGLIDEISLAICPAVDGAKGAPSVFDSSGEDAGAPAPIRSMTLETSQVLDGGAVWLRYRLRSG
jgi:riboflavin biosynthesis pyrimidine reductase